MKYPFTLRILQYILHQEIRFQTNLHPSRWRARDMSRHYFLIFEWGIFHDIGLVVFSHKTCCDVTSIDMTNSVVKMQNELCGTFCLDSHALDAHVSNTVACLFFRLSWLELPLVNLKVDGLWTCKLPLPSCGCEVHQFPQMALPTKF